MVMLGNRMWKPIFSPNWARASTSTSSMGIKIRRLGGTHAAIIDPSRLHPALAPGGAGAGAGLRLLQGPRAAGLPGEAPGPRALRRVPLGSQHQRVPPRETSARRHHLERRAVAPQLRDG